MSVHRYTRASLWLKEMGAYAMAEVAAVVRCAYGRVWVDTGAVVIALAVVVEDDIASMCQWSTWQSPV
jgi:hypothetical protein